MADLLERLKLGAHVTQASSLNDTESLEAWSLLTWSHPIIGVHSDLVTEEVTEILGFQTHLILLCLCVHLTSSQRSWRTSREQYSSIQTPSRSSVLMSNQFTTGGLQSMCRNISMTVKRNARRLS